MKILSVVVLEVLVFLFSCEVVLESSRASKHFFLPFSICFKHILTFKILFLSMYMHVCECMLHVCKFPQRPEEGIWYPGQEPQAVLSCQIWALGTKLGSPKRVGNALKH